MLQPISLHNPNMDETLRYISEPPQVPLLEAPKPRRHIPKIGAVILGLIPIALVFFLYLFFISAPSDFPKNRVFQIEKGETLSGIASELEAERMIKSAFLFKVFVKVLAPRSGALAGDYQFNKPQNSLVIAWRVAYGAYDLTLEKITIPEGLTSSQIAAVFAKNKKFSVFNAEDFKRLAIKYEGYLFPDTYLFLPNVTAAEVIKVMTNTYKKKIDALASDISVFGRPINEVVTMASILEEEGRTKETREAIAGILWKRLAKGMLLQVDASVVYLTGKKSGHDLVQDDFKIDSPYNTYMKKGLPPTPISNPGLAAISAAVNPTPSNYYFYITDPEGGFHPAVTFEEHLVNKAKYLR